MHTRTLLPTISLVLVIAACGSGASSTTQPPTTTQPETTTTLASEAATAYTKIENLVYLSDGERELDIDVYAPKGEGPFPVAILFHGIPSSKDDPQQTTTAEGAAEAGMLVFVPNWKPTPTGGADRHVSSGRRWW